MNIAEKTLQLKQDFDDVYEAGKNVGQGDLWDNIQDYGNRTHYNSAFSRWNSEYIRPRYKVVAKDANGIASMFDGCSKLKKVEAEYFDFSQKSTGTNNNTGYYYTFANCSVLEEIEDLGLIPQHNYYYAFSQCYNLHTIAKMGVDANTKYENTFHRCDNLVNLTLDGIIGQNGFDIHWSTKLSPKSLYSIIKALSTTTTGLVIKLPSTAEANYNANPPENAPSTWAELVATKSNWSIAYA